MPRLTEPPRPNGLPSASTVSPSSRSSSRANWIALNFSPGAGIELEQGHVALRVAGHHRRRIDIRAGAELDRDLVRPPHHVVVGQQVARLVNDDSRAEAVLGIGRLPAVIRVPELAEELLEGVPDMDDRLRGNVHHAGHHLLHGQHRRVAADVALRGSGCAAPGCASTSRHPTSSQARSRRPRPSSILQFIFITTVNPASGCVQSSIARLSHFRA